MYHVFCVYLQGKITILTTHFDMKRITLSLLTLLLVSTLKAETVSKQAALFTAQSYMIAKGKTLPSDASPVQNGSRKKAQASDSSSSEAENWDDALYIFNASNDGGYVIVSGDDRVEPILGYVDHGSFDPDNIPDNMRAWLQGCADDIRYIVDNNISPDSPILKKRNKISRTKHSIPELLTTRWNQGHPYNLTCPKYYKGDGTQAYPASGCVATAMAQVVNHYKFPEKTKAIIPAHSNKYKLDDGTEKTVTVRAVPRNTPIYWEEMRDTYSCNDQHVHDAADTAVANLVLYCGQAVKMGWGASSGASTSRSRDVFVNYFGYDDCAYWGGRGDYYIDEWFDMLYDELDAGYPVLYAGHSSGGGHAFVLDGFDGDNLFHVNWGWGGGSNGWFLVSILNPGDNSGIGASSSSDGYSMSQGALFNLRLPDNVKADTYLNIKDVAIINGSSVKATFENKTGTTGNYTTGIVMLEEDGSYTLVGTRQSITSMANDASQTKTFPLKKKLPEGTYKLSPASKLTRSEVWRPKYDMRDEYIEAVVGPDSIPVLSIKLAVHDVSIDTIVFPGTRIVGQEQEVKVTFRNNADEYYETVYLFASKTQDKVYTESKSKVAIRRGETLDVSYFFKPEETGTYNLWLCTDDKGNNVVGEGTVEIIDEADAIKANLSISYTISNLVNGIAYGKRLMGKAVIRNNGSQDFHGSFKLQIWSQQLGSSTAWSGSSRSYSVDIPIGKTASVEFDYENLNEGYYYRFKAMYSNQEGTLTSGGIWDHKWEMQAGLLTWKNDGTVAAKPYSASVSTLSTICGVYADCSGKISRMSANRNPNTIYAFAPDMYIPANLDTTNVVSGGHARHIRLYSGNPYYLPKTFEADSASFTYTFPETETGTGWHTFTMPFKVDSIFVDSIPALLGDSTNHFWIYEFAAQGDNGEVIFAPATELRGGTPYIIAADSTMAGRSIVFRSLNAPFFKSGSDKMIVSSPDYKFYGSTYSPKLKDCYILNAEGTAFEYVTTTKTLPALTSYFITDLPEELRLPSIVLPEVPTVPGKPGDLNSDGKVDIADAVTILDIMAGEETEQNIRLSDMNKDGKVDIADFVVVLDIMAQN